MHDRNCVISVVKGNVNIIFCGILVRMLPIHLNFPLAFLLKGHTNSISLGLFAMRGRPSFHLLFCYLGVAPGYVRWTLWLSPFND
jgi:hypothetical protein